MHTTESRKLNLIDKVLRVKSEKVLAKIEMLLMNIKVPVKEVPAASISDFSGFLTKKEAEEMKEAINMTCETIDTDVWK